MKFVDGAETEEQCPKCGKNLVFEMSFTDEFSYPRGHYTRDRRLIVCSDQEKCNYYKDYEEDEEAEI